MHTANPARKGQNSILLLIQQCLHPNDQRDPYRRRLSFVEHLVLFINCIPVVVIFCQLHLLQIFEFHFP